MQKGVNSPLQHASQSLRHKWCGALRVEQAICSKPRVSGLRARPPFWRQKWRHWGTSFISRQIGRFHARCNEGT